MILLERLELHDFGALKRVVLEFRPRGTHLVSATSVDAGTLRGALAVALFGGESDRELREASIELAFSSGGLAHVIRRTFDGRGRERASLRRVGPPGQQEVRGPLRVQRELDRLVGLDRDTFNTLIHPDGSIAAPSRDRLSAILRSLLGQQRLTALEAAFATTPQLEEAEELARTQVQLAEAARELQATAARIEELETALKRARVIRALESVETAERRAQRASADVAELGRLRERLSGAARRASAYLGAMELWRARNRASDVATHADVRGRAAESELRDMAKFEPEARTADERLAVLERSLAAYGRAETEGRGADGARTARDDARRQVQELLSAGSNLAAARIRLEKRRAQTARAETLQRRAQAQATLPEARRLWDGWAQLADADAELDSSERESQRLRADLGQAERALRRLADVRRRRQTHMGVAGAATVLGATLLWLGASTTAPIATVGVLCFLAGASLGGWALWSARTAPSFETTLAQRLHDLETALRNVEARLPRAEIALRRRRAIEAELRKLALEVPQSEQRAGVLRDSATTQLRALLDADARPSAQKLDADVQRALVAVAEAERELRRLEARVETLTASEPGVDAADREAELVARVAAAARARNQAIELARSVGLPDDPKRLTAVRERARRASNAARARLARVPNLELWRQRAIRDQAIARDDIRRLDAQLDELRMRLPDLPASEPEADRRERAGALAALAGTLATLGDPRARAGRRKARSSERTARLAIARSRGDLDDALRAAGVVLDEQPSGAEIRALFLDHGSAQEVGLDVQRPAQRRLRKSARELDARIRRLELRGGLLHEAVEPEEAQARLAEIMRQRRVRSSAGAIVAEAFEAVVTAIPAIAEARLRLIIGPATMGSYWDARIDASNALELWDESRERWIVAQELDPTTRRRVELARRLAFAAAAIPHDAQHSPAFVWFEADESAATAGDLNIVIETLRRPPLAERWPQVIVTAPHGSVAPQLFARCSTIVAGVTPDAVGRQASRLEAAG